MRTNWSSNSLREEVSILIHPDLLIMIEATPIKEDS